MSHRHIKTLYDVAVTGQHLKASCLACQHEKIFDAGRLWWLYQRRGWSDKLTGVARHLRCASCGGKNIRVTNTLEKPTGIQPIGPTDREWKEHVRRQRD